MTKTAENPHKITRLVRDCTEDDRAALALVNEQRLSKTAVISDLFDPTTPFKPPCHQRELAVRDLGREFKSEEQLERQRVVRNTIEA